MTSEQECWARLDGLQDRLTGGHSQPDKEQVLDICHENNYTVLGLGGQRICLAINFGRVAKPAWRGQGLADSLLEMRLWQQADPELRQLLAPPLALTSSGVLIEKRCIPIAATSAPKEAEILISALARQGITDAAINLGLFEGRLVCLDYARLGVRTAQRLLGI